MRMEMEMKMVMGEELMNERWKKDEEPANKGRGWPREAVITYAGVSRQPNLLVQARGNSTQSRSGTLPNAFLL